MNDWLGWRGWGINTIQYLWLHFTWHSVCRLTTCYPASASASSRGTEQDKRTFTIYLSPSLSHPDGHKFHLIWLVTLWLIGLEMVGDKHDTTLLTLLHHYTTCCAVLCCVIMAHSITFHITSQIKSNGLDSISAKDTREYSQPARHGMVRNITQQHNTTNWLAYISIFSWFSVMFQNLCRNCPFRYGNLWRSFWDFNKYNSSDCVCMSSLSWKKKYNRLMQLFFFLF